MLIAFVDNLKPWGVRGEYRKSICRILPLLLKNAIERTGPKVYVWCNERCTFGAKHF